MAAYLIANVDIKDAARFAEYGAQVPAVIAAFGGRYLIRGGKVDPVEGNPGLHRLVVLEFPDMAKLQAFYHSPEYAPLITLRASCTVSNVALVEGYAG